MVSHRTHNRMLSTHDAADILGVHVNTVRRWGNSGIIKVYRIGPRRDRRFHLEDIVCVLTKQSDGPKNLVITPHQTTTS